jgi:Glyoxalase-like domain
LNPATEDHLVAHVDHLVVMATSLAEGAAWCEATLGVTPGPGGEHPLMGTHNRLINIMSPAFVTAYLEIIAIDSVAVRAYPARARRWFDMDNPALSQRVAQHGPQLIHWVASVPKIAAAVQTLAAQGIDRGPALEASRMTPHGLLQWQITVRDDGQRLFDGCLPTLIQWGSVHPTDSMPRSGVTLQSLHLSHPQAPTLQAACRSVGLASIPVQPAPARITATLQTPRGLIEIHSEIHSS